MLKKHISADYSHVLHYHYELFGDLRTCTSDPCGSKSLKVDLSIRIGAIFYLLTPFIRALVLQKRKTVCVWTNLTEIKIAFFASRKLYHFPWTYVHSSNAVRLYYLWTYVHTT